MTAPGSNAVTLRMRLNRESIVVLEGAGALGDTVMTAPGLNDSPKPISALEPTRTPFALLNSNPRVGIALPLMAESIRSRCDILAQLAKLMVLSLTASSSFGASRSTPAKLRRLAVDAVLVRRLHSADAAIPQAPLARCPQNLLRLLTTLPVHQHPHALAPNFFNDTCSPTTCFAIQPSRVFHHSTPPFVVTYCAPCDSNVCCACPSVIG